MNNEENRRMKRSESWKAGIKKDPVFPENFAEILLAKEMQLDQACTLQLVTDLVQLYGQAVEHYHGSGTSLHLDYQERMHRMLIRPEVLNVMKTPPRVKGKPPRPNSKPVSKPPVFLTPPKPTQREKQFANSESNTPKSTDTSFDFEKRDIYERNKILRSQELQKNMLSQNEQKTNRYIRVVNVQEQKTKENVDKVKSDLQAQNSSLATRMASRKRVIGRNQSVPMLGAVAQDKKDSADSSAGTQPAGKSDNIEKQIEQVMETWFALKATKTAEIKVKYTAQIGPLEDQVDPRNPNDVMPMVIAQLRQSEATEIENLAKEIDEQRREEVRKLRERLAC